MSVLNTALRTLTFGVIGKGTVNLVPPAVKAVEPIMEVVAKPVKAPVVKQELTEQQPAVKHLAATLRAVIDLPPLAKLTDMHGDRGVCVEVIDDDVLYIDNGKLNAEVVILERPLPDRSQGETEVASQQALGHVPTGDTTIDMLVGKGELVEVPQDALFWEVFAERIRNRGVRSFHGVSELIMNQKSIGKGYSLVLNTESNETGIVHVTKAGLNALFPQGDGMFRVVSNNKRFNGEAFVKVETAKGFLNGRY